MSRYTSKLQNIQEANIRLEERLLTEQQTQKPNTSNVTIKKAGLFGGKDNYHIVVKGTPSAPMLSGNELTDQWKEYVIKATPLSNVNVNQIKTEKVIKNDKSGVEVKYSVTTAPTQKTSTPSPKITSNSDFKNVDPSKL